MLEEIRQDHRIRMRQGDLSALVLERDLDHAPLRRRVARKRERVVPPLRGTAEPVARFAKDVQHGDGDFKG